MRALLLFFTGVCFFTQAIVADISDLSDLGYKKGKAAISGASHIIRFAADERPANLKNGNAYHFDMTPIDSTILKKIKADFNQFDRKSLAKQLEEGVISLQRKGMNFEILDDQGRVAQFTMKSGLPDLSDFGYDSWRETLSGVNHIIRFAADERPIELANGNTYHFDMSSNDLDIIKSIKADFNQFARKDLAKKLVNGVIRLVRDEMNFEISDNQERVARFTMKSAPKAPKAPKAPDAPPVIDYPKPLAGISAADLIARAAIMKAKPLTKEKKYVQQLIKDYATVALDNLERERAEVLEDRHSQFQTVANYLKNPKSAADPLPLEISNQVKRLKAIANLDVGEFIRFLSFSDAEGAMQAGHEKKGSKLLKLYIKAKVLELLIKGVPIVIAEPNQNEDNANVVDDKKPVSDKNKYYIDQLERSVGDKRVAVETNEQRIVESSNTILYALDVMRVLTRLYIHGLPHKIEGIMQADNAEEQIIAHVLGKANPFPFLDDQENIESLVLQEKNWIRGENVVVGETFVKIAPMLFEFWEIQQKDGKISAKHVLSTGVLASKIAKYLGKGKPDWDMLNDWVRDAGDVFSEAKLRKHVGVGVIKIEDPQHAENYAKQLKHDLESAVDGIKSLDTKKDGLAEKLLAAEEKLKHAYEFVEKYPDVNMEEAIQNAKGAGNVNAFQAMMDQVGKHLK